VQGSVWESYCSLSICLNLFRVCACFAYGKTVINQCRVEKSAFEDQSEENSVWILKWTTLLGIFCKISFTAAVTFCHQVHALKTDTHIPTAALICYFRCHWCRNLSEVNCIMTLNSHHPIHAADGHYTRNSSCITSLWLHHNPKMSISYHKRGLVSIHQPVGKWLIFWVV